MTTVTRTPASAPTTKAYEELITRVREAHLLGASAALLHWDQEVLMPARGVEFRSRQMALLARLRHERLTDPRVGELLADCEQHRTLTTDALSPPAVNVRELRRIYDRATRLPADLVEEEAHLSSLGHHHWREARRNTDFAAFLPWLERIVALVRRKAACYGWPEGGEAWDALAEDYEPGATAAQIEGVFTPLRERLRGLIQEIMGSRTGPGDSFNAVKIPLEQQRSFVRFVAEAIGFDFERGRLDVSTHPFCSGHHPSDVRLTTRFHDDNTLDALGSTMHESGHGMYEQGLLLEHAGTPMGEAVSLGIHESQSRMWENQVGRSHAFWQWLHPRLKDFFGPAARGVSLDEAYGAANVVRPGFIRVEADEATYNMHIFVRFEIERALLAGDFEAADVPATWNDRSREYLGVEVPDDARGCLQDIHWSGCSFGYFPTYTLGNLYAAQLFEQARRDIPDLEAGFRRGGFSPLLTWLNQKIHAHGQRYRAGALCEHVTGEPLSAEPLLRHIESKLRPLYGI